MSGMDSLKNRFTYLRNREALAALVLPPLFMQSWMREHDSVAWGIRIAAVFLLSYILLQGTWYWHLKLRSTQSHTPLPSWFGQLFTGFKWSNLVAFGAIGIALWMAWRAGSLSRADLVWSACLLGGALLEQINYFHYQLMYDTRAAFGYLRRNRRLRKAALGLDLARVQRTIRTPAPGSL